VFQIGRCPGDRLDRSNEDEDGGDGEGVEVTTTTENEGIHRIHEDRVQHLGTSSMLRLLQSRRGNQQMKREHRQ
jgi:hypothetical protein